MMTKETSMAGCFDAVTLEILWKRLIAAVDEASVALVRVAFSSVVRESSDFACVITDTHGRLLAQATASIPSFIGTLPRTVRHFIERFDIARMKPGDVFVCNDPWYGTGHLSDVNLTMPIFHKGTVVGFAASTAHAPDIGGRTGSMEMRDVFEEGFQIPALKLMDAGRIDATLIALLRANVRAPDEVVGDLYAQITGLEVIEQRVLTLMEEHGLVELSGLVAEIHDRSEAAMRAAIAEIPAGTYRFTVTPDGLITDRDEHQACCCCHDTSFRTASSSSFPSSGCRGLRERHKPAGRLGAEFGLRVHLRLHLLRSEVHPGALVAQ